MLFETTRQAYYPEDSHVSELNFESAQALSEVRKIRAKHPSMGVRKLYVQLEPFLLDNHIKMGRDALFDLLAAHGLLVRRRKSIRTTHSSHWLRRWPNLIKGMTPTRPNELWACDITYWQTKNDLLYISLITSLITDAYSHKILGYAVSETLAAIHAIEALQ